MIPLAKAIDELMTFLTIPECELSGERLAKFDELDNRVFEYAADAGPIDHLPKVSELAPQVNFPTLRPASFHGNVNLPGDWIRQGDDRRFVYVSSGPWEEAMLSLRKLAEAGTKQKRRPQTSVKTKPNSMGVDAEALAVFIHHPDWTKKRIAEQIGRAEKSLAPGRCPKLNAAIQTYKSRNNAGLKRGSKDRDGNLEAWDEDK